MISDKTLLRIAVVVFAVGFAALFVLTQFAFTTISVRDINENMIGEKVSVTGIVKDLQIGNILSMQLRDSGSQIRVVMFNPEASFESDDLVAVNGEVALYKGDLEIIANRISKIE